MTFEESRKYSKGNRKVHFYDESLNEASIYGKAKETQSHVLKPVDLPWEDSRQGKLKHLMSRKMNTIMRGIEAYMQEIPPGGKSGKHRHMGEELLFILEGKGHDLHWDIDPEIEDVFIWKISEEEKRFDWEVTDCVYIPPNTVHQHFNDDPKRSARFVSVMSGLLHPMGYEDTEQLEEAPS